MINLRTASDSFTITMSHGMYHIKEERSAWWKDASLFEIDASLKKASIISIHFDSLATLEIHEEAFGIRIIPILDAGEEPNRFRIRLPLPPDEPVFGCGEQFSHLDLRGKRIPLWVSEPGIGRGPNYVKVLANLHSGRGGSEEHTYFPQPSFVTATGRWVLLNTTAFCRFDFTPKNGCSLLSHAIPSSLSTAAGALSATLGRQKPLPDWASSGMILGLQGGRAVVEEKLRHALDAGLPGFIKELHERGVKFLGYNNPFLSTDAPLYAEGERKGCFIKNRQSLTPYITSTTTFPIALVDLCNPQACSWYKGIIKNHMLGIGMDGWMADFGEYLPPDGELFGGSDPYLEHNRYPVRWAQLNAQAVEDAGRGNEIVYFCRSAFTGSSSYVPLLWAGDQIVNFLKDSGLPAVVPAAVSSALSGFGYWHFDIGGFFSFAWIKRSRNLLMRSCELAAFTPVVYKGRAAGGQYFYGEDLLIARYCKSMQQRERSSFQQVSGFISSPVGNTGKAGTRSRRKSVAFPSSYVQRVPS